MAQAETVALPVALVATVAEAETVALPVALVARGAGYKHIPKDCISRPIALRLWG